MARKPHISKAADRSEIIDRTDSYPRRLTEGLHVLGNFYFNLYLVRGAQASALIEVGVSGVVDEVIGQLESLKVSPTFLVVTHPHADHLTGLAGLKERFGDALVVAGEGAPDFVSHPRAAEALVAEDRHMTEVLASRGLAPGRPSVEAPPAFSECVIARDGDEMDLGGVTLRFLTVKGHSPGNINVYLPELEALIASDSVGFRFEKRGFYPIFFTSFTGHIETLDRLRRLRPRILGVGHQGPRIGPQVDQDFEQARKSSFEMRDRIVGNNQSPEQIAKELFGDCYKDEFLLYSPENILGCCRLLVKRVRE